MDCDYVRQGNSLEIIKDIPDKSIDVSFTSPPYNRIRNDTYEFYDDTLSDYYQMLVDITEQMLRVTKKYVIVNIQCNYYNKSDFYRYIGKFHDRINGIVIWEKINPTPTHNYNPDDNTRSVTNSFEYFIVLKDGGNFVTYGKEQFKNVIQTCVNNEHFEGHGAIMRKDVCSVFIRKFTEKGDVILDPFFGCGTTGVCAIENGRHYIGFELQPEYVEMARKRIEEVKYSVSIFGIENTEGV